MTTDKQNPGRRMDCMGCKVSLALVNATHICRKKNVFGFGRFWSVLVGFGRFWSVFGRFQMSLEPFAALRAVC
eukprot:4496429-Prymnesium_polylepis.1